ncbi:MAG TPA: hypothetical protein VL326_10645 [Kofleriaceae bacterium]|nr:hypothetical protein [Kofleriaceae bacterium]
MRNLLIIVLALFAISCTDDPNEPDPNSSGGGKGDGYGASVEADAISKAFGIVKFDVSREASGFTVVGRDASGKQVAHGLIYDTRNEITVRNVDGRTASYTGTSDASGDRSVYRIGTATITIRRDASGDDTYELHDDSGATDDVSFDGTDGSTLAQQSKAVAMDPEVAAIFAQPVAVLLTRLMLDSNLAAELARQRMSSAGGVSERTGPEAAGGFCEGSLPSDVKLALDAKTGIVCAAFVVSTALSIPTVSLTLATGEVGPLVILTVLDTGLGLSCLANATHRTMTESLKLLPCAVAYIAGAR